MKIASAFILASLLCLCLTFAGKSLFGMEEGVHMDNVECVNHCINSSVFPSVPSTALPILLFVVFSIAFVVLREGESRLVSTPAMRRMTEQIRLLYRKQTLIPVMIRD